MRVPRREQLPQRTHVQAQPLEGQQREQQPALPLGEPLGQAGTSSGELRRHRQQSGVDVGVPAHLVGGRVVAVVLPPPPAVAQAEHGTGHQPCGPFVPGRALEDLPVRRVVPEEAELGQHAADQPGDDQLEPRVAEPDHRQDEPGQRQGAAHELAPVVDVPARHQSALRARAAPARCRSWRRGPPRLAGPRCGVSSVTGPPATCGDAPSRTGTTKFCQSSAAPRPARSARRHVWSAHDTSYSRRVLDVALLGPLEVRVDGAQVEVPSGKSSELLARLALEAGELVSAERLVEDLWASTTTEVRRNTLQSKVAMLRRALGPASLASRDGGYALEVEADHVDVLAVQRAAATAARLREGGEPEQAADLCGSSAAAVPGNAAPGGRRRRLGERSAHPRRRGPHDPARDQVLGAARARWGGQRDRRARGRGRGAPVP